MLFVIFFQNDPLERVLICPPYQQHITVCEMTKVLRQALKVFFKIIINAI